MRVAIYSWKSSGRTRYVARALQQGFSRHGIAAGIITDGKGIRGDLAIAYGWNHEPVFSRYLKQKLPFIYLDLGYWARRPKGAPRDGYYRLSLNDWCTSKHMLLPDRPPDRFNALKIDVKPWGYGTDDNILITGMSMKAAASHHLRPGQWERDATALVRQLTDKPVIQRAKPTSKRMHSTSIEDDLRKTHLLLTHHSNTAVDALVNGVPYYCVKGVARRLSLEELNDVNVKQPRVIPDDERVKLLYDIAYCQWNPEEMRNGLMWEYVKCVLDSV